MHIYIYTQYNLYKRARKINRKYIEAFNSFSLHISFGFLVSISFWLNLLQSSCNSMNICKSYTKQKHTKKNAMSIYRLLTRFITMYHAFVELQLDWLYLTQDFPVCAGARINGCFVVLNSFTSAARARVCVCVFFSYIYFYLCAFLLLLFFLVTCH